MPLDSPRPIISVPSLAHATGFPARSIPHSFGAHIVAVIALLLLGLAPVIVDGPPHLRRYSQEIQLQTELSKAPLLPSVESSSASASSPASAASFAGVGRNGASSASSMLLIHQRRQHIISNTPDATNPVQTILQPDLERPARLTQTLPIPSMVRMAPPQHAPTISAPKLSAVVMPAAPPAPTPVPQPTLPKVVHTTVDTVPLTSATALVDKPKLAAFATTGRTYDPPKPPKPATPAAPAKPAAPTTASTTAPSPPSTAKPATGTDSRNLLVVNAFEVESHLAESEIPRAEIHGRFEVTDAPSLPNGPTNGGSSNTVGVAGSGVADSGNGAGKGRAGSANATGAGSGGGKGKGAGNGTANIASSGSGHGAGIGTGAGEGAGHGTGNGLGSGSGSGAGGNGSSPFSGMTIAGGTGVDAALRSAPVNPTVDPHDPRPGYGLTIVSSGNSGGAVRDLGVFDNGPVYTVYIDVTRLGIRSRWSLQYSASRDARIAHPGVPLTPPFAQDERLPQLPPAAVAPNIGRTIVVQANLKADGKLEAVHVVESPDQRLNEGIVASLSHWYFEPAAMGGDRVPVKVLLGIPITATMADNGVSQQADQHTPGTATVQ